MIQIIFDYEDEPTLREIAEEENSEFNVPVIPIPEMEDAYLTLIEPEKVQEFVDALKIPPLRFDMIGSYNIDGTQYIWTNETGNISWNHSINKYKAKLKDIVEYDEEGNEVSRRQPTQEEALNTQVNKISGHGNRILS